MDALLPTRRRSLAWMAAAMAVPGVASGAEPGAALGRSLPEAEFTPDDGSADLLGMEDVYRRMTAPVMINGKGPFDFVVDTGTNRSIISDDLAASLGLPAGRAVRLHGIGGVREAPTAALERFQVGGREAARLSLPILPAKSLRGAGILGVDGLKNQRLVMDLGAQRLRIEPSSKPDRQAGDSVIKARRRFGQLTVVDTDLQGVQVSVMIDTGSEVTVGNTALQRAVYARRKMGGDAVQKVALIGATGESTLGDAGGVPDFRMGLLQVRNLRVIYADLHPFRLWELTTKPAMLMGMDVIRFFDVLSLDFGRNEVRCTLPKQPYIDPAGEPARRAL